MFGKNRDDDPRYAEVLERENDDSMSKENRPAANIGEEEALKAGSDVNDDPAACSQKDMIEAIKRCQVGRNSASYAVAMNETPEETQARRAKEILIEESEETKRAREQIRLALGSPMG